MDMLKLGPNGALVYCMEFLETNFEWLISSIRKFPNEKYFLFDFPGQVTKVFYMRRPWVAPDITWPFNPLVEFFCQDIFAAQFLLYV